MLSGLRPPADGWGHAYLKIHPPWPRVRPQRGAGRRRTYKLHVHLPRAPHPGAPGAGTAARARRRVAKHETAGFAGTLHSVPPRRGDTARTTHRTRLKIPSGYAAAFGLCGFSSALSLPYLALPYTRRVSTLLYRDGEIRSRFAPAYCAARVRPWTAPRAVPGTPRSAHPAVPRPRWRRAGPGGLKRAELRGLRHI